MKKSICLFVAILWQSICMFSFADSNTPPIVIVHLYAEYLKMWNETKNVGQYSEAIKDLCSSSFRVNDDIMSDYAERTGMPKLVYYDYNDYEKCWDDIIKKGVTIQIKNIRIDNSAEFNAVNYGVSDSVTFVSADVHIKDPKHILGGHYKEIFRITQGKITHILDYDADKTLADAFRLCMENKYQEAYDIFESIIYNSNNFDKRYTAVNFATAILLEKGKQLEMDEYLRKYKLARNIYNFFRGDLHGTRRVKLNLPKLNNETYNAYMRYKKKEKILDEMQNFSNLRHRHHHTISLHSDWNKAIPYVTAHGNDEFTKYSGALYYEFIKCYRQLEKTRFPKVSQELYGFVDADGKEVIPAQYKFAYPFDEEIGLALVQHRNGKWGYIDMQGKAKTLQNYDVASDVFVDGKTNVIRNDHLILIDQNGNEIKSIYGYKDLSHELGDERMTAISIDSKNHSGIHDLIDFNGNIIEKDVKKEKAWEVHEYTRVWGCSLGMNF